LGAGRLLVGRARSWSCIQDPGGEGVKIKYRRAASGKRNSFLAVARRRSNPHAHPRGRGDSARRRSIHHHTRRTRQKSHATLTLHPRRARVRSTRINAHTGHSSHAALHGSRPPQVLSFSLGARVHYRRRHVVRIVRSSRLTRAASTMVVPAPTMTSGTSGTSEECAGVLVGERRQGGHRREGWETSGRQRPPASPRGAAMTCREMMRPPTPEEVGCRESRM
jgi:hypothetical protein